MPDSPQDRVPSQQRDRLPNAAVPERERKAADSKGERQSLAHEADNILAEARMVLPGIQTVFGFQLIVPFNDRFNQLADVWQDVHLAALVVNAVALALIITPAAYHRLAERGRISRQFIKRASRFITFAMCALAVSMVLDVLLVGHLVTRNLPMTVAVAAGVALLFAVLWFAWPLLSRRRGAD
jgi:hypothetical protein